MRLLSALLLLAGLGLADTVTFRDGHTVNGSFLGGDARSIRVAVGDRVENYPISDITDISFGGPVSAAPERRDEPRPEFRRQEPQRDEPRQDRRADGGVTL